MNVTVTIDRASLSLADLVLTNDPSGTVWIEDFSEPDFEFRYRYAPDSDHVAGSQLLTAVLAATELPLVVNVKAASTAARKTLEAEIQAALGQFSYDVTLTVDGASETYSADPVWPTFAYDSGMAGAFMSKASVSIPINPPGA